MVFTVATTADEVQKARPHTLMRQVVSMKWAIPWEWKGSPEAEMRSKKLYIASLHGPKAGRGE